MSFKELVEYAVNGNMQDSEVLSIIVESMAETNNGADRLPISESINAVQEFMHSYKNRGIRKVIGDNEVRMTNGVREIIVHNLNGVTEIEYSGMSGLSIEACFVNSEFTKRVFNDEISLLAGFYRTYLLDDFEDLCFHNIWNKCMNDFAVGLDNREHLNLWYIRIWYECEGKTLLYQYAPSHREDVENESLELFDIQGNTFVLNNRGANCRLKDFSLERAIYDYSVSCYSYEDENANIPVIGVFSEGVFFNAGIDARNRICHSNNLRKYDYLQTGKLIHLSKAELKKYKEYVAKCDSLGEKNKAELFIKQNGTPMIIYP